MWTFRQPYLPSEPTAASIDSHGRIALYRALSLGRLVVVTGSGVSAARGLPRWAALADMFVEILLREAHLELDLKARKHGGSGDAYDDACREKGAHLITEKGSARLGLDAVWVEFRRVAELDEEWRAPTDGAKIDVVSIFGLGATLIDRIVEASPKPREPDMARRVRARFAQKFEPETPKDGFESLLATEDDPIYTLKATLGITRILTLNYDLETEKEDLWALARRPEEARRDKPQPLGMAGARRYERLLQDEPQGAGENLPRTIWRAEDLPKRRAQLDAFGDTIAESTRLKRRRVGELITFAVSGDRRLHEIAHWHGRKDDPESMVLSRADYNALYLGDARARRVFDEARNVLYAGNFVLFVGVGMKEDEVLRPLEEFVREVRSDQEGRQIFALLPMPQASTEERSRQKCASLSLSLKERYGVFVLYYGRIDLDHAIEELRAFIDSPPTEQFFRQVRRRLVRLFYECISASREESAYGWGKKVKEKIHLVATKRESPERRKAALETLQVNLRAAALAKALRDLQAGKERWWRDWQSAPRPRQARFLPAPSSVCGSPSGEPYLWLRHRTEYRWSWSPNPFKFKAVSLSEVGQVAAVSGYQPLELSFDPIQKLKKEAKKAHEQYKERRDRDRTPERQHIERGGQRILRAVAPRGGGKGALLSLLQRREIHESLFPRVDDQADDGPDRSSPYAGVFCAQLALSTEFSSVITALSRFLAERVATVEWETGRGVADAQEAALKAIRKGAGQDARSAAKMIYIAQRAETPSLALPGNRDKLQADELEAENTPPHRLDILKQLMRRFAEIAKPEHRCLIILSGLDRICDRNGDGFSPMHRAFFRLLSRAERKPASVSEEPPLDLILIAGDPETPICYLSQEVKPEVATQAGHPDAEAPYRERDIARRSKTGRVLVKWPLLPPFKSRDRLYLTPLPQPELNLTVQFVRLCEEKRGYWSKPETSSRHSRIARLMHECVAIQVWVQTALAIVIKVPEHDFQTEAGVVTRAEEICKDPSDNKDVERYFGELIKRLDKLDRAAAIDGFDSVVLAVEQLYEAHDRRSDHIDSVLLQLIMRHLTLFSMPVELWVLYGCPLISERLTVLFGDPSNREESTKELEQWRRRTKRLEILHRHLTELARRALILRIAGALGSDALSDPSSADSPAPQTGAGKPSITEQAVHYRYALNQRLRQFYADRMQLSLPDVGDSNHFQLSVYCDQPNDLPTPSAKHFALVRDILNRQIDETRKTLWLAFRNVPSSRPDPGDADAPRYSESDQLRSETQRETEAAFAALAGARRLLQPPEKALGGDDLQQGALVLAGSFARLYAMPQRLRACFSLVRGAFSLGAISRLDLVEEDFDDKPFELYRGWLRALLNAAAGLANRRERYDTIFDGDVAEGLRKAVAEQKEQAKTQYLSGPTTMTQPVVSIHMMHNDDTGAQDRMAAAVRRQYYRDGEPAQPDASSYWRSFEKAQTSKLQPAWKRRHTSRVAGDPIPRDSLLRDPYYRDEIAWLYNERGLASLVQGKLFDALPLLRQASFIMRHRASAPEMDSQAYHAAERRIELNMAIARIERGAIERARRQLEELISATGRSEFSTPSLVRPYALGYLALCDHLSGSLEQAIRVYVEVLAEFNERRRLRPVALFNMYLAELYARTELPQEAMRAARLAVDAAAHSEQRDVLHEALLGVARLLAHQHQESEAIPLINRAEAYARRMGLERLRALALIRRAEVLVDEGESDTAGRAAAEAAAICNRNGMGLHKLEALAVYGAVLIDRGERVIAERILAQTKRDAERIGYQLVAARVQSLLNRAVN